jgi:CheY-specific phosphatase CheX
MNGVACKTLVSESVAESLHLMFGMEVMSAESVQVSQPALTASVGLHGDVSALVAVTISAETGRACAVSATGEADVDCAAIRDVVGELANVIAGSILTRLSGDGFNVDIDLPVVVPASPEESWLLTLPYRVNEVIRVPVRCRLGMGTHEVLVYALCQGERSAAQ